MKKILIFLFTILFPAFLSAQSYKIIVNSGNGVTSLSKQTVSDYFLKKDAKWENGTKISPVDQKAKSAIRGDFSSDVHGKSVGAIQSYWQQYVFSGKGTPPVEKDSDADIISYVKSNEGAIGYVSSSADVSGVKVIELTD